MSSEEPAGAIDALLLQQLHKIESQMESDRVTSAESRRRMYLKQDDLEKRMWALDHRLENMEKAVTAANPFLIEYQTYQQRVIGAGIIGRWLWRIGGVLLSMAASAGAMYVWLSTHLKP